MVAKACFLIDLSLFRTCSQRRRGQLLVQAPAHILGIRLASIAPPGVALVRGVGMQPAVHIHQRAFRGHVRHPCALFWQKAAVLEVALPVFQIGLLVRNVHIAANNEIALGTQRLEVGAHVVQEAKLGFLPFRTRRTAGEISTDDRQLSLGCVKAHFYKTTFGIKLVTAHAHHHIAGFMLAVNRHTRIAFFLGKVEMALEARQRLKFARYIGRLCFNLLHANTIGIVLSNPSLHPFGGRRTDAVQVQAG